MFCVTKVLRCLKREAAPPSSERVSDPPRKLLRMQTTSLEEQARDLGADHAELHHLGRLQHRLHSGRDVAAALGAHGLDGEQTAALREAYNLGWSSWA